MAGEMAERIGRNMRRRREQLGLKQREVAERIDDPVVSGQHVSRWERAENRPGDRYLDLIASALDVDVSYFFADHDAEVQQTPTLMTDFSRAQVMAKLDEVLTRISAIEARVDATSADVSQLATEVLELSLDQREREAEEQDAGRPSGAGGARGGRSGTSGRRARAR